MKKFYILLCLTIMGCSTTSKKPEILSAIILENSVTVRADCSIQEQPFSEDNLTLTSYNHVTYFVKAQDGKNLALPVESCLLSQTQKEVPVSEDLYWVKCKLPKISFVSDKLSYSLDEKHFYKLTNQDGRSWYLPRIACSIYKEGKQND